MASREEIAETVERIVDAVGRWEGATVGEHRFGGTEFRVGPREFSHVHAWGMLDIPYYRPLRDALVDAGETGIHHLLTESGGTTYYVESADDFEHARWLLRLSYLYNVKIAKKTPAGAEEFAAIDVDGAVAELDLPGPILAAFERRAAG